MSAEESWLSANQRVLMAELAVLRERLERCGAQGSDPRAPPSEAVTREWEAARAALPAPSGLDVLCRAFSLSAFERGLLLLSAGSELDAGFGKRCATAQGDVRKEEPTVWLALGLLPGVHWSALAPDGPLRRFQLIELAGSTGLMSSAVRIHERVLHHLVGLRTLDERLLGLVEPVPVPQSLPRSWHAVAERMVSAWGHPGAQVLQLIGTDAGGLRTVAAAACGLAGLEPHLLRASVIPATPGELEVLSRLLEREAFLSRRAVLVDLEEGTGRAPALTLVERLRTPVLLLSREQIRSGRSTLLCAELPGLEAREQRALWEEALGSRASSLGHHLDRVVSCFPLGSTALRAASAEVEARAEHVPPEALPEVLWDACRAQARPRLEGLAQRIEPRARWEDLVLPPAQLEILRNLPAHVRQRARVYGDWGFGGQSSRGMGLSALFCGPSGTGKTMAAEVLAAELRVDLYRIDLSQVVDKYIGETEKNLRRVFDTAEESGALLLFDEADALFGKRSEVKDSHDRYANIEVGYLLQRLEAYRGLTLLTTNMRGALDTAFLRRIRFVVEFPFPSHEQRVELWRRAFPRSTPTEDLDVNRLARLGVAGGNIRNIALSAAFLAADAGEPVRMTHLRQAARSEYAKLERPLAELEGAEWN
ncbi:MAG: AAA family ATPase [Myxococcaceae bacterium]|nr:AAA family ATPase [Myxococcaceae bacterium]